MAKNSICGVLAYQWHSSVIRRMVGGEIRSERRKSGPVPAAIALRLDVVERYAIEVRVGRDLVDVLHRSLCMSISHSLPCISEKKYGRKEVEHELQCH